MDMRVGRTTLLRNLEIKKNEEKRIFLNSPFLYNRIHPLTQQQCEVCLYLSLFILTPSYLQVQHLFHHLPVRLTANLIIMLLHLLRQPRLLVLGHKQVWQHLFGVQPVVSLLGF